MTSMSKLASVLLFSGLAVAHGAAPVSAGDSTALHVAPLKGITLSVGPKRAVGYYAAAEGACNLTLMIADAYSDGWDTATEPVRLNTIIREGTTTQIDTLAGKSLAFSCGTGATTMTVQPVDRMAYAASAK